MLLVWGGGGSASGANSLNGSETEPFLYPTLSLLPKEYGKVLSEINTYYHMRFEGKEKGSIIISKTTYWFEIHGFDDYNIYYKSTDK